MNYDFAVKKKFPPRISCVLSSFGRLRGTCRALTCIFDQTEYNWELFFIGDNCDIFEQVVRSGRFKSKCNSANLSGSSIIYKNLPEKCGSASCAVNSAIKNANGELAHRRGAIKESKLWLRGLDKLSTLVQQYA